MNAEIRRVKLRPCPFCGEAEEIEHLDGPPELRNGKEKRLELRTHWYYCVRCKAAGPTTDSIGEAAIAWNGNGNGKEERR